MARLRMLDDWSLYMLICIHSIEHPISLSTFKLVVHLVTAKHTSKEKVASFPGSTQPSVTCSVQVKESWVGPGNEAKNNEYHSEGALSSGNSRGGPRGAQAPLYRLRQVYMYT